MKKYEALLSFGLIAFSVFAGGRTDSGRDSSLNTIEAGKFVNPETVDAYAYVNDYIVFIHNPEVLLRTEWKYSFISVFSKIRQAQGTDAVFGIFNPLFEHQSNKQN
jgi:hypothetical protein